MGERARRGFMPWKEVVAMGAVALTLFGVAGCGGSARADLNSVCFQHAATGPDIQSPTFDSDAAAFFDWVEGVSSTNDELNALLQREVSVGRNMLQQGDIAGFNAWADAAIAVENKCQELLP